MSREKINVYDYALSLMSEIANHFVGLVRRDRERESGMVSVVDGDLTEALIDMQLGVERALRRLKDVGVSMTPRDFIQLPVVGRRITLARRCTLLKSAAVLGRLDVVRWLVEQGADVNVKDQYGATPLLQAAVRGYLPMVQYLLDNGATDCACTYDGKREQTPLSKARASGHFDVVSVLEAAGFREPPATTKKGLEEDNERVVSVIPRYATDSSGGGLHRSPSVMDHLSDMGNVAVCEEKIEVPLVRNANEFKLVGGQQIAVPVLYDNGWSPRGTIHSAPRLDMYYRLAKIEKGYHFFNVRRELRSEPLSVIFETSSDIAHDEGMTIGGTRAISS